MASSDARTTSPGTVARKALPCLERSSGAAMDPVTEMTVSSRDWLICSVISDSFLTLKNSRDHQHNRQAGLAVHISDRPERGRELAQLPLEALVHRSALRARLAAPAISTDSVARAAGSLRTEQISSPLNLQGTEVSGCPSCVEILQSLPNLAEWTGRAPGWRRPRCT